MTSSSYFDWKWVFHAGLFSFQNPRDPSIDSTGNGQISSSEEGRSLQNEFDRIHEKKKTNGGDSNNSVTATMVSQINYVPDISSGDAAKSRNDFGQKVLHSYSLSCDSYLSFNLLNLNLINHFFKNSEVDFIDFSLFAAKSSQPV